MLMWCLNTFYYNAINYIKTQLSHCFKILKYYSAKTQKDIFSVCSHYLRSCVPQRPPLLNPAGAKHRPAGGASVPGHRPHKHPRSRGARSLRARLC